MEDLREKKLFGHPRGLTVLFFTEMWERFSYYGMRGLLVLYLVDDIANGGFGWSQVEALSLYGTYTMMVYIMGIPGGILADKFVGQKKAVMIGGGLLVLGHGVMALPGEMVFYAAITLIVLGVGALKANISTMVGQLYKQGDPRRDKGFTIFYMGINLGSALSSLIVGYVGQVYGWHWGFGLAGIGMLFGQIQFMLGGKYLEGIGELKKSESIEEALPDQSVHLARLKQNPLSIIVIALVAMLGAYIFVDVSYLFGVMIIIASVFLGVGINIYKYELNKVERDRVVVLLISFLMVIAFFGAFEQAGGLMNLYTDQKTDKSVFGWFEMTAAQFQFFNPGFILLFGIPVAGFWAWMSNKGKEDSALFKMATGNMIMGLGFVLMVGATIQASGGSLASMWWIVGAYLLHTVGELCLSPVSLSFVTKLAPVKYGSIMMGLYFAMTGLGNKVAGLLGESASHFGEYEVFAGIGIFSVVFGLLLVVFLRKLKKLTHGAEDIALES
ncbi:MULTISPECIES: peptide MFS transporter [Reichenbachiella]|uniref:peptide MFS transporter n=1 Tax=Reichenbachiella TaxID=156993 RepID=UPI000E6CDA91|nr:MULTISPECIES: peptide MFS transporter [Reichenbachiella]MBU2914749.1 peptide MFS transporter [Reichenbachiella agariperforans]RJE75346.1 peptide permease [Reichenbachiella sp. MSK19-1]